MANIWKPKWWVLCRKCGWCGKRAVEGRDCPKCGYWHPQIVNHGHLPKPSKTVRDRYFADRTKGARP